MRAKRGADAPTLPSTNQDASPLMRNFLQMAGEHMRTPQKHAKKKLQDMPDLTDFLRNPWKRIPHGSMRYSILQQSFYGGEKGKI